MGVLVEQDIEQSVEQVCSLLAILPVKSLLILVLIEWFSLLDDVQEKLVDSIK